MCVGHPTYNAYHTSCDVLQALQALASLQDILAHL